MGREFFTFRVFYAAAKADVYKRQVFSSPLVRAVETANILFPNASHQFTVHDLREAGFGVFENRPVKDLVKEEDFKK